MATIINTYTNYVSGTGEADVIYNYVSAYIHGNDGNDQITNGAPVALISGDDDNDVIVNCAFNSQTYLNGGEDSDYIWNAGSGVSTLYGGYDVEDYYEDNDILIGSPYAVDFFVIGEYCGCDLIQNYDWNDAIFFATTSGYPPYIYNYGADVIIQSWGTSVTVQGAAYKPLNFGYMGSYNEPSYDTASDDLWGASNVFYGTADADNIFISKGGGNDLLFNADASDTIHLHDVTLDDIVGTAVNDTSIAIAFNTGETAVIASEGTVSATFKLASGESYVYNRVAASWQKT